MTKIKVKDIPSGSIIWNENSVVCVVGLDNITNEILNSEVRKIPGNRFDFELIKKRK